MTQIDPAPRRRRSRVQEQARTYEQPQWEELPQPPSADDPYAAYYSREGAEMESEAEPSFAAPVKLNFYGYESQFAPPQMEEEEAGNVYHPRAATWAEESAEEIDYGYQVQAEDIRPRNPRRKTKRRHTLRNALIIVAVLALLGGAAWLMREPILAWLHANDVLPASTEEPFAVVATPEPVKAYDEAQHSELGAGAAQAIAKISGDVEMETHIVTDSHIVTRSQRKDGSWDFYLFTADKGRLLCYFEGLDALDMIAQENGSFFVDQAPYLISPSGSALIRTADIERRLGEGVRLHPLYRGWAVVESLVDGSANYVSQSGQVLSTLWFSRTFPFTGAHTLAYVDTGMTADTDQRYLLYVVSADGTMSRWLAADHMEDAIASACGMAYMSGGKLYRLPDTSKPVLESPHVEAYLDCDAVVVQDPETGKYGLLVHGEQHYDYVYDRIAPVESDVQWASRTLTGEGGTFVVHAVDAAYPQMLSHSFVLEKGEQREYVALSTRSSYPIRLEGAFETEGMQ